MKKTMISIEITQLDKGLNEWCILHAYRGSIAHNMYIPNSDPNSIDDKDTMAICLPNMDYYFGLDQYGSRGTKEIKKGQWDIVIYELKKAVSLLEKCNPNILSLLWVEEKLYIQKTEAGQLLIDNRHLFSSKKIYHAFVGYAKGQLHKMTNLAFEGYMGEKRKALVKKFGYDTKNAAHLIRLLRMCIEFLNEGFLYVSRVDNQELLAIKKGEWELDRVKEEAERLFKRAEDAYDRCKLPATPDRHSINKLLIEIFKMHN